jgi:hypothetical protein
MLSTPGRAALGDCMSIFCPLLSARPPRGSAWIPLGSYFHQPLANVHLSAAHFEVTVFAPSPRQVCFDLAPWFASANTVKDFPRLITPCILAFPPGFYMRAYMDGKGLAHSLLLLGVVARSWPTPWRMRRRLVTSSHKFSLAML